MPTIPNASTTYRRAPPICFGHTIAFISKGPRPSLYTPPPETTALRRSLLSVASRVSTWTPLQVTRYLSLRTSCFLPFEGDSCPCFTPKGGRSRAQPS